MTHNPHTPPKAMDFAAENDWNGYFKAVAGKPPRDTLVKALDLFDADVKPPSSPRLAVDLACGEGRDTLELLRRNWRVIALDAEPEGINMLRDRVPADRAANLLRAEVATFAQARWPACDLLNCSYALPFCPPDEYSALWQRIVTSINPGGRFAGQLFGTRDTWARSGRTSGTTRADLDRLFTDFIFDNLIEEERDDKTTMGELKHWHVFHIVARKH